jgi:hypothetical protein
MTFDPRNAQWLWRDKQGQKKRNVEVTWLTALDNRPFEFLQMTGCVLHNRHDSARLLDYSV